MLASLRLSSRTRLAAGWISIALVAGIIQNLVLGLSQASWCGDCEPLVANILLGSLFGIGLAHSRFGGKTVAAFNLLASVGVTLLTVGRVLPALATLTAVPFSDVLWWSHLRTLTLLDRLSWGIQSLLQGQIVRDTTLLTFAIGWMAWGASVWLMWCVARRRRAMEGLLPCAGVLVLNVWLGGRDASFPIGFILCAVLLVARTAYTERRHDWETRRVDYPDLIWEDWSVSVAILSAIVVAFAWVSTPEGQRALRDLFAPIPQSPGDAQFAVRPDLPRPIALPLIAQVPDLRVIGRPIPQSDETVMWVRVSEPQATAPQHYWRSAVFARYTGTGWESEEASAEPYRHESPTAAPPGRYVLKQQYEILAHHGRDLFAVNTPVLAGEGTSLHLITKGDAMLQGTSSKYEVTSWATGVTAAQLHAASQDYPPAVLETYLQLPDGLPPRVRTLAARITHGASTPYEKAIRTRDYLRLTYPYQLEVPTPPPDADAVDYFLFDAPGGFCTYYASAMAVMLRVEGVPARVATGFATGEYDATREAYRVPASASHAWVEVYFPAYGWVEFEPTAALASFDYADRETSARAAPAAAPSGAIDLARGLEIVLWAAAAITVLLLSRSAVGFLRRRLDPGWRDPRRQAHALYWHVRRALAHAGLDVPGNVTPDEFLATYADVLTERDRLGGALRRITKLYVGAAYTSKVPAQHDVQLSRNLWRRAWPDRARLQLRALLARMRRQNSRESSALSARSSAGGRSA